MRHFGLVLLFTLSTASVVIAEDDEFPLEGLVHGAFAARDIVVELSQPRDSLDSGPIWWQEEFEQTGSDYLRIHLTDIRTTGDNFALTITNRVGKAVSILTRTELADLDESWTDVIRGSYALLTLTAPIRPRLSFRIDGFVFQARSRVLLSIIDPDDRMHVADYADDAVISHAASSVAKLSYIKNMRPYVCSGFLIADDLLMTNQHCVSDQAVCETTVAIFGYQFDTEGHLPPGRQHRCLSVEDTSYERDVAVLKLAGAPGKEWGQLQFAAKDPVDKEELIMIQHPAGQPKQVSRKDCVVFEPSADGRGKDTDFAHGCDTLSGSSGSPVLNIRGQVVGLHHYGFGEKLYWKSNRAVKGSLVKP